LSQAHEIGMNSQELGCLISSLVLFLGLPLARGVAYLTLRDTRDTPNPKMLI
jgi:hypothetical protein